MRYQKIHSQIWSDEKFQKLSEDGKFLFIYLMTSPHSNGIGLYVLPKKYIECDLEWTPKRLAKPFKELLKEQLVYFDETVNLICIRNHLKHNPIENQNQVKFAVKIISGLPKSNLHKILVEQLREPFHKPLVEQLQEPFHKQLREQYAKPEEEEEEEEEEIETVPSKIKFLDFVFLTKEEHEKLIGKFGEQVTKEKIETLNLGIGSKGYKYKSHYMTILNWDRMEKKRNEPTPESTEDPIEQEYIKKYGHLPG